MLLPFDMHGTIGMSQDLLLTEKNMTDSKYSCKLLELFKLVLISTEPGTMFKHTLRIWSGMYPLLNPLNAIVVS